MATSENEYIGLSPLTLDDVRNFFDTYIRPFAPYQEEKVYDTLINNLTEYYFNQTYFNIPSELKQMYEEVNFDAVSIYDKLLVAIGVPNEIINNISLSNKIIFLKTLSDFERYKGSVSFFQKVSEAFSDRLSIYELFVDLDGSDWVFKPVKLYLHGDMTLNTDSIPYATVSAAVPSLILSEEQLTTLYEEEKLILPIKSNLILLDNDSLTDISILYDVIVAIFLHTYKENYVDLYFKDSVQNSQLKTVYFLWYYLLTEYSGITWSSYASTISLKFLYEDIGFPTVIGGVPTTIDSLSQIVDRYDNIKIISTTTRDVDNRGILRDSFYKDIADAFYTFSGASATTATDMYNSLLIMNSVMISYIDDRITNTSIGKKAEINLILSEIYSSILLYSSTYIGDVYFNQYVDYFLRYLPQILIKPENTTSYTILYNLKPYHVELYSINNGGIRSEDKFNQVYIDDETNLSFLQQLRVASVLDFSVDYLVNFDYFVEEKNFEKITYLPGPTDAVFTFVTNSNEVVCGNINSYNVVTLGWWIYADGDNIGEAAQVVSKTLATLTLTLDRTYKGLISGIVNGYQCPSNMLLESTNIDFSIDNFDMEESYLSDSYFDDFKSSSTSVITISDNYIVDVVP